VQGLFETKVLSRHCSIAKHEQLRSARWQEQLCGVLQRGRLQATASLPDRQR